MTANPLIARGQAQWSLVAQDSEDVVPLRSLPAQIGRHPGVPVRVIHPTVSLVHAEIRGCGSGLELVDLSSRNGTFVNGKKVLQSQIVHADDLLQFGAAVFRLRVQVQGHSPPSLNATCQSENVGDLALALAQFEKLVNEGSVVPVYQPIVTSDTGEVFAYEALARSRLFGLDKPAQMFQAAEYFHMEAELSRLLRREELVTTSATGLPHLFLNTHPTELTDFKDLIVSLREIRAARPEQPLTIEVHEAAAADIGTMKMLRIVLEDLKMKLAYDDFGAGQARLHELVDARPDYVKFDRKMVTQIDQAEAGRRHLIESLVKMCKQLGITTLAEGVETEGEADACREIGFELMQGFFFGRPAGLKQTTNLPPPSSSTVITNP
ncbi:MAG: EAL domain-containing protein [Planctomycetia bacterium]|jgi:EAL domain-containing protein (putative c-di-GMP-specific phosphodiesterase class I)|nr:EAL domain-containing protein [Planctomycetia bacterium]